MRVPKELVERDPELLAPAAGLTFVPDDEPGVGRGRRGDRFVYTDAFGATVTADEAARIDAIAIPPAWTDVWICPDPSGYLQASGYDDAGRKQYRYHDGYRAFSEGRKFERLAYFGRAVVLIRKAVAQSIELPVGERDHAVAAAVRLIDAYLLRVGNHQSAANGHYGATTLTVDHVIDDGTVELDYIAKSGKERSVVIDDDDLAELLTTLADDADDELFWFDDDRVRDEHEASQRRRATADDINRFIAEHAGSAFSARDFRTWGASRTALEARADGMRVLDAVDEAAAELGNTRAVARNSYIHPTVLDADDNAIDHAWKTSRSSKWLDRSESALTKLITS